MLDLNFSITQQSDSVGCDESKRVMEDSETSNSSVVSNGRDEDSSVLIFDIIKKEKDSDGVTAANGFPPPELVTRPLFPVTGNGGGWDSGSAGLGGAPLPRPHWLNLSSSADSGVDGPAELRIVQQKQQQVRKSRRGPRSRSSQYRGVTFYRRTGRWESHIWDCGKQVYLGGFDTAHAAARAYDRAAIKFRGVDADINFNISDYDEDMKQMKNLSKEEFVQVLRRQSTGFSRGGSKLRGLSLQKYGRWEAQMGQIVGKKIYDGGAIKGNEREAVITNFEQQQRSFKGETMPEASNGGNGHNLDLSLGISLTSGVSKARESSGVLNHHHNNASQKLNIETPTNNENNASAVCVAGQQPHILSMASKHPPSIWSGFYSGFLANNEERATEKRIEAICSTKVPSWGWQMQGNLNGKNTKGHICINSAASSGFSSSATSSPTLPSASSISHSLSFPLPTTPSTNS